jgi:hypothetical protein
MEIKRSLQSIPDGELLRRLADLLRQSRRVEADVVAHIAEVDERGLYAHAAFPSMFVYVTKVLHLSEREAYLRITVARASRNHPVLLTMLADGRLHLTAIGMLAPHLTHENRDRILERATHKSKRQIEEMVAEIAPRPDVPAVVRKLPDRPMLPKEVQPVTPNRGGSPAIEFRPDATLELRPDGVAASESGHAPAAPHTSSPVVASPAPPSVIQPLSPGRYKVQFTASAEFYRKLERLRALMSSQAPGSDLAAVIEEAVSEKLERLEARRFARTRAPRQAAAEKKALRQIPAETKTVGSPEGAPNSRHIPAAVRRTVHERDGGRCCFVDALGRRCPEQNRVEFHHRHPFGLGGDHSPANVGLMCPAHNAYLAECDYGRVAIARHRRPRVRAPQPPAD